MKKTFAILSLALFLAPLAVAPLSCSQPPIQCVVGHGAYFAKYKLLSGDGSCAELKGEEVGLSTFLAMKSDGTGADYDKRRIAIQSSTLGGLLQERKGHGADLNDVPFASGDYTADPDPSNICFAGGAAGTGALSVAEVDVPEAQDDSDPTNPVTLPARHLRQKWENVSIYVTAAVPGTQMHASMTYEDLGEGCKATYDVIALFPAVRCAKLDADGKETQEPDDVLCDPRANPAEGRDFGSGINPDFKVKCDPELLYCVLDEPPLVGDR